jgi:hypothetical protein
VKLVYGFTAGSAERSGSIRRFCVVHRELDLISAGPFCRLLLLRS